MPDPTFDVIVIGAGPAGENAAATAAGAGLRVAVVESELVGGECTYWACIPSKTLLRPGEVVAAARRTPGAANAMTGSIDLDAALGRRDQMVAEWDDSGQVAWLDDADITLIRGHGRLDGERRVTVRAPDGSTTTYVADRAVVLAMGSAAAMPDLEGIDQVDAWDSRGLTAAKAVPASLAIIGAGPVGAEMAQAWAWLGSDVTLLDRSEQILSEEEPFVGEEVREGLESAGVTVLTSTVVESVSPETDGLVTLTTRSEAGDQDQLTVARLAVAVGRIPRLNDAGLETVGLTKNGFVEVNDQLQVQGVEGGWLYAVGDVNGRALLTHVGKYQARIAGAHITGEPASAGADVSATPRVVFTSSEVGAVGLTEKAAREAGIDVAVVSHDIGKVSAAHLLGRGYKGTAQLVIDRARQVIVGATFVGPSAGEIVHSATIAVVGEVPLHKLWHAIPAFPTVSEIWLRLLEDYQAKHDWNPYE